MNTMNMSDYQKIIFVNTIDESEIINDYPIDQLSSDYPFAVFFTENSNSTYNDLGYKVRNIWYKGDRLTRFVGVQTNNNFEINGHEFKLHFEYDNGLLSIVEANKLNNISLTHIQWIDAITETQMTLENNIDLNNIPTIYAKDNKFSLRLKFECDAAADLLKISPAVNFKINNNDIDNNFINIGSPKKYESSENTITYTYNCIIKYESSHENNAIKPESYLIESCYDTSKNILANFSFYLNPIELKIYIDGNISNKRSITLLNNTDKQFSIKINPNNGDVHSYPENYNGERPLYFKISSTDPDYISIYDPAENIYKNEIIINIETYEYSFKIKTSNIEDNVSINGTINVEIYTEDSDNNEKLLCSDFFKINSSGEVNNCYFYCNYINSEDLNSLTRADIETFEDYTGNILYDWTQYTGNYGANTSFYFIIPVDYIDKIVPCCDIYETNALYQSASGGKKYISLLNNSFNENEDPIFEMIPFDAETNNYIWENFAGTNKQMIVYKYTGTELFHGKIQIQ